MEKIIKLAKNNRLPTWLIAIGSAFTLFSVGLWWVKSGDYNEIIRNWIFAIGALGAFYGLVLAKKRQDTFSHQVDKQTEQIAGLAEQIKTQKEQAKTAEKQVANEMLVQGFSLLAHENITMRRSGIRVLEDLAQTSPEHARQIFHVILDYIKEKARIEYENGVGTPLLPAKPREDRFDIELAIEVLTKIRKQKDFATYWLVLSDLDLRRLHLINLDLRKTDFHSTRLEGADFSHSKLYDANFAFAKCKDATFFNSILHGANFFSAKLDETDFFESKLYKANFFAAELKNTLFVGAELIGVDISSINFMEYENEEIKDPITEEQIGTTVFNKDIPPKNLPFNIKPQMDRAYSREFGRRKIFAHGSLKGKNVDEQVAKEIAEAEAKKGGD